MKILFAIDILSQGGASHALWDLHDHLPPGPHAIACGTNRHPRTDGVHVVTGETLYELFLAGQFNVLHWFRTETSFLFDALVAAIRKKGKLLPVITTLCQAPTTHALALTPNEIQYSQHIVFITQAGYRQYPDPLIPPSRKSMVYFGTNPEIFFTLHPPSRKDETRVCFGRGSTLNKCHPDFIEWFNAIPMPRKQFLIIGHGDSTWITRDIRRYGLETSVCLLEQMSLGDWIRKLGEMDVFLYQLPLDAYSAIDYTVQHAMLMELPVVYYGPEAPKELVEHGQTGFIANDRKEFIHYASLLGEDRSLRKDMGKNARNRIQRHFTLDQTLAGYQTIYARINANQAPLIFHRLDLAYDLKYRVTEFVSNTWPKCCKAVTHRLRHLNTFHP